MSLCTQKRTHIDVCLYMLAHLSHLKSLKPLFPQISFQVESLLTAALCDTASIVEFKLKVTILSFSSTQALILFMTLVDDYILFIFEYIVF